MKKSTVLQDYSALLYSVKNILEEARKRVYHQVNIVLVKTYWEVGKRIVEFEQGGKERAPYGEQFLLKLSEDLCPLFGQGFSAYTLGRMRAFYLAFPKWGTVSPKLSWSHYRLVIRLDNPLARAFYMKESANLWWSVRELERQINSMLFERLALSKDKKGVFTLAKKGQILEEPKDIVKDPYILEFLGLEKLPRYTEAELEERIITHLEKFLLELGKGFAFVARQQRIIIEDEHFFVDLVFYNRILRCFVLLEIKLGTLSHRDLGQLQMYVHYFDRTVRQPDENKTIGILLGADKNDALVRYTLPENNKQLFASKYKLYLPEKKELEERLKKLLKGGE